MDDVNDHMDELFRRAAENYPLKTESGDWSKVLSSLSHTAEEGETVQTIGTPKRNPIKGFLLLFVFMFPWIYLKDTPLRFEGTGKGQLVVTRTVANNDPTIQKVDSANGGNFTQNPTENQFNENTPNTGNRTQNDDGTSIASSTKKSTSNGGNQISTQNGGNIDTQNTLAAKGKSKIKNPSADYAVVVSSPKVKASKVRGRNGLTSDKEPVSDNVDDNNKVLASGKGRVSINPENKTATDKATRETDNEADNSLTNNSPKQQESIVKKNAPKAADSSSIAKKKEGTPAKKDSTVTALAKKETSKKTSSHFLYAGIMAGPDASVVKFQSIKSIGISSGIVLGYQINKKWAIESGLFWDKKFYYTTGKYFDPKHLYLPTSATLNYVNGGCGMWEIPLAIRYHFTEKKTINWFASVGVSSYIVKNESYDYNVTNNMQTYFRYRKYTTVYKNWLGAADMSVGFTHALRKSTNFRVETYFKLPLKKIGTGSLDVTSTGINIGITQKLF